MRAAALLLFGIHLHLTCAAIHSLQYIYTAVSGDINFPDYTAVGLVDDEEFMYFDSITRKAVPKTEWIRQHVGADYWNMHTDIGNGHYATFKNNIQILKERFNQTAGVHTLQAMYGCDLDDVGITRGYWQYGYDGSDYISFDKSTLTWTAANPQAVITKHKWDPNRATAEYRKAYLENECIEWLRKYVSYSKDSHRKVPPEVSLLQKDPSSPVLCHATGFYPSNIMMTWKKNQEEHFEDVEVSTTLPNEDGTFQRTSTLSVTPEEWKKNPDAYRCVVQHAGTAKEIAVILNEKNIKTNAASGNIIATVVGCVVCPAVLAAIIGLIVRKKSNHYKASLKDSDSVNSDEPILPKA